MLYVPAVLGREGWEVQEEDYDFIKPVESEVVIPTNLVTQVLSQINSDLLLIYIIAPILIL